MIGGGVGLRHVTVAGLLLAAVAAVAWGVASSPAHAGDHCGAFSLCPEDQQGDDGEQAAGGGGGGGFDAFGVGPNRLSLDEDRGCFWVIETPDDPDPQNQDFFEARDRVDGNLCTSEDNACSAIERITLPEPEPEVQAGVGATGVPVYLEIGYADGPVLDDDSDLSLTRWDPGEGAATLTTEEGQPTPCGHLEVAVRAIHEIDWEDPDEDEPHRTAHHGEPYPGGAEEIVHTYQQSGVPTVTVTTTWAYSYQFEDGPGEVGGLERLHERAAELEAEIVSAEEAVEAREDDREAVHDEASELDDEADATDQAADSAEDAEDAEGLREEASDLRDEAGDLRQDAADEVDRARQRLADLEDELDAVAADLELLAGLAPANEPAVEPIERSGELELPVTSLQSLTRY